MIRLVTQSNADFFSPLSGKNGNIIEASIIYLYQKTYGDDFTSEEILDRKMVKSIISRVLQDISWQDEYEENPMSKEWDKASYILERLIICGWIVFEMDRALSMKVFNFTKNGKKFAQMLYSLSDEDSVVTRQRNVRTTLASLEAYQNNQDPYDLIDAMTFSKYIVSDLTDNINDLKEAKNLLMKLAIEDVSQASGKFISFLEDDFSKNIAVKFGEDSATKHTLKMTEIIEQLMNASDFKQREEKLIRLAPSYANKENPLEDILYAIEARFTNACDKKLPQLKKEISTYIQRGGSIFRQTNSLVLNKNRELHQLATIIKSKREDNQKRELLSAIGSSLRYTQLKILNLSKIKIHKRQKKEDKVSFLQEESVISKELYIQTQYEQQKHLAFNFSQEDIRNFIDQYLATQNEVSNNAFEIKSIKDLLVALYATDIMFKDKDKYTFEFTKGKSKNIYFQTDEYIIHKGGQ